MYVFVLCSSSSRGSGGMTSVGCCCCCICFCCSCLYEYYEPSINITNAVRSSFMSLPSYIFVVVATVVLPSLHAAKVTPTFVNVGRFLDFVSFDNWSST